MSKQIIEFTGPIKPVEGLPNNGIIEFPYDLKETFGKKSVKVKITYNGIEYRGLLKSMGGDCVWCLIRKDIRACLGFGHLAQNGSFSPLFHLFSVN